MKHLLLVLLLPSFFYSQESDTVKAHHLAYFAGFEQGSILATNPQLKDYNSKQYQGYSFEILKQTTGNKNWKKLYNQPKYGIGFFAYNFLQNKEMGSPFAIYGIYNQEIKRWNKWVWDYNVNFGISFNSNAYNYDSGYLNSSLGSKTNMFISLSSGVSYELGKHFNIGLNLKFNHLSNGSLKVPNRGLNSFAPQISMVYYPERVVKNSFDSVKYAFNRYKNFEFSVFGGRKNFYYRADDRFLIKEYEGYYYNVYGAQVAYFKQYSAKSAYGIGFGITQDDEYNHQMYIENEILKQRKRFANNHLLFSVEPSYRLMIDRLYVNIGLGYYILKKTRPYDTSAFYQKIGLQYQISDKFFASFGVNAFNFHVANYLEWKIGYTFDKKKINH